MASSTKKKKSPKHSSFSSSLNLFSSLADYLPSSKVELFRLIAVVSVAAAVAVTCNFIVTSLNQLKQPFCDTITSDYENSLLSNDCELCPENGVCYDGKLECSHGYRNHGKLCVEDGDVSEAAKKFSKFVEVRVCEAYAQFLCSGTGKCWFSENELWNNLYKYDQDNNGADEAIFMLAKQRAMETIRNLLETRIDNYGSEEVKCPELLVDKYKPLSCVVRQWIIKNALVLGPTCALLLGCILIASRVYRRHQLSVRAEQLYHEVCDILEEKLIIARSVEGDREPWVVASSLRDHLLSPKERKNPFLWKKVEELVQEDSRVDQYPKLVKGESKVVWEWQVEGSVRSSGKKRSTGIASNLKESTVASNIKSRMYAA